MTLDSADLFPEGKLDEKLRTEDEKMYQELWKGYFKSMTIKERIKLKLAPTFAEKVLEVSDRETVKNNSEPKY